MFSWFVFIWLTKFLFWAQELDLFDTQGDRLTAALYKIIEIKISFNKSLSMFKNLFSPPLIFDESSLFDIFCYWLANTGYHCLGKTVKLGIMFICFLINACMAWQTVEDIANIMV